MVISIMFVIVGLVALVGYRFSVPEMYPGDSGQHHVRRSGCRTSTGGGHAHRDADERVDNMNYMYSLNANSGTMRLVVNFDVATT